MIAKRILATAAMLAVFGSAQASRILEQPERSYELTLSQLSLPSAANGGLTIKPCASCPYTTHVLTAATEFFANERGLPFAEFTRVTEDLRADRDALNKTFVGVYVDVETGRVNRVTLRHPEALGLPQ
jgi:hypothetical protein